MLIIEHRILDTSLNLFSQYLIHAFINTNRNFLIYVYTILNRNYFLRNHIHISSTEPSSVILLYKLVQKVEKWCPKVSKERYKGGFICEFLASLLSVSRYLFPLCHQETFTFWNILFEVEMYIIMLQICLYAWSRKSVYECFYMNKCIYCYQVISFNIECFFNLIYLVKYISWSYVVTLPETLNLFIHGGCGLPSTRRWLLPGTWSHLWFSGVRECPPWCLIVGATVTVHQFFCILHCLPLFMMGLHVLNL